MYKLSSCSAGTSFTNNPLDHTREVKIFRGQEFKLRLRNIETQIAPQNFVITQKMKEVASSASIVPKYRVILSDSNKINRVQINNKIQIAKINPVANVVGCKIPAAAISPPLLWPKDKVDDETQAAMRKKAYLDQLSPQERMQRRKLNNRVAAQNSRNKKKAQTEEMEKLLDQIRVEKDTLAEENVRLQALNTKLQIENAYLIEENTEYKQKLGLVTNKDTFTNQEQSIEFEEIFSA